MVTLILGLIYLKLLVLLMNLADFKSFAIYKALIWMKITILSVMCGTFGVEFLTFLPVGTQIGLTLLALFILSCLTYHLECFLSRDDLPF